MRLLTYCVLMLLAACGQKAGSGSAADPPEPVAIAPGRISTPAMEFAFTLTPDGRTAYFNREAEDGGLHIWASALEEQEVWGEPQLATFSDPRYDDVDPFVSRSGDRMYFSSTRPIPGAASDEPIEDMNTWFVVRTSGGWSEPRYAGEEINSAESEVFVSEDRDGNIYFARFGEGEGRDRLTYLMTAQRSGDDFSRAVEIPVSPAELRIINPAVSADGRTLIVAARTDGPPDLFFSRRNADGEWSAFEQLGEWANMPDFADFAPYLSNDAKRLYFTSDRSSGPETGGRDIFMVEIPEGAW